MPKTLSKRTSDKAASSSSKPSKAHAALQLGGFTVLPLLLSQPSTSAAAASSSSSSSQVKHYLYVRADTAAGVDESERRTLFVANLPVDADEDKVRAVFGEVGAIEDVSFGGSAGSSGKGKEIAVEQELGLSSGEEEDSEMEEEAEEGGALELPNTRPRPSKASTSSRKAAKPIVVTPLFTDELLTLLPSGSSTAKVTFLSPLSLLRALALPARAWPTSSPAGLAHFLRKHETLRPPLALVKAHADSSILAFERLQAEEKRRVTDKAEMVDEDGFTLVVRGGKYGKDAAGGGVGVASKKWESEWAEAERAGGPNKKKKSKELKDFYRWQVREAKREDLAEMRSKFAEDQKRVEKLKAKRRFMPY